jgi:hypothetical protein
VQVRVTTESGCFERLTDSRRFRLGRSDECGLRFEGTDAAFVSWEHAEFVLTADGECYVTDLNSSNGTYVDGVRISVPTLFAVGSVLQVGRTGPRIELVPPGVSTGADASYHEKPGGIAMPTTAGVDASAHSSAGAPPSSRRRKVLPNIAFQLLCWIGGALLGLTLGYYILSIVMPDRYTFDPTSIFSSNR